jgi:glycogen debranching enzyme
LRQAFDDAFWNEELGTYALALDGEKKQCAVTSSNPGHCLSSGIAFEHRASRIADSLLDMNLYSGWGIRTVGAREVRYNPMSYHNGSVWPHDNAIIARGLAGYNLTRYSLRVLESMFEASVHFDANRMPELFCGFRRRAGDGPTLYPVACSPQSWASASIYMLLQSCLGMTVDAVARHIHFRDSCLPESVQWLNVENLTVANCRVDFTVRRLTRGVEVEVHRRDGELEIAVMK